MNLLEASLWDNFVEFVLKFLPGQSPIVWILTLIVGFLLSEFWKFCRNTLIPACYRIYQATWKLKRIQSAIAPGGKGIWLADKIPIEKPKDYDAFFSANNSKRIPIIVVANLKGGVGKTTTAANLIAHYANKKGETVLGIDFDYQGSLSSMCLSDDNYAAELEDQISGRPCRAASLLEGKGVEWLLNAPLEVNAVNRARLIPSFYSLASAENRVMIGWLAGIKTSDVRYQLASMLHDERICSRFQRIIIDAPPRLTTASIQALCAATHVIIPTVLDDLSAEAVGTFAQQLYLHREIWPNLRLIGALGTMTEKSALDSDGTLKAQPLSATENSSVTAANDALKSALGEAPASLSNAKMLPVECFTPDKTELSRAAGHQIAYALAGNSPSLAAVRMSYDRLGDEIDTIIGWGARAFATGK